MNLIFEIYKDEEAYAMDGRTHTRLVPGQGGGKFVFQIAIMGNWSGPIIGEKGCLVNKVKRATNTFISIGKPNETLESYMEITNDECLLDVVPDMRTKKLDLGEKVDVVSKAVDMLIEIMVDNAKEFIYKVKDPVYNHAAEWAMRNRRGGNPGGGWVNPLVDNNKDGGGGRGPPGGGGG